MPVVKLGLLPGREADFGKITENKSSLRWLAVTNSNLDTDFTVWNHAVGAGLPIIPYVSAHPTYDIQVCRNTSIKQDSGAPRKFIIESTFSSEPLRQSEEETVNPLQRPPKVKWGSTGYRLALAEDRNGEAIVNSAGDYFDPPVEADRSHWTVTIEKNVAAIPTAILDYADAINQSAFQIQGVGVGPEVAKLMEISLSERQTEGEFSFFTFSYTMELRAETWSLRVLDQGMRYVDGANIKQILDDHTPPRPVTSPRLLDGSGGILENPTPGTAEWIEFDIYIARDFSILPGLTEAGN